MTYKIKFLNNKNKLFHKKREKEEHAAVVVKLARKLLSATVIFPQLAFGIPEAAAETPRITIALLSSRNSESSLPNLT